MGTQNFFFVPRLWQDETHLSLQVFFLKRGDCINWPLLFSLTNKNISVWVRHTFQIIFLILPAWVMRWITAACVTIEVIINTTAVKIHSIIMQLYWSRHYTGTLIRNLSNQFTSDWPLLLLHYATRTFLACNPVVDIALDQEFLANAAPQSKIHGLIMGLAQRNGCGHSNVSRSSWPRWTRGNSVSWTQETWVISEGVTVN